MKTRIRFRKANLLTKLLLLVVVIFAVTTLVSLQGQITQEAGKVTASRGEIAITEQEKLSIENDINELNTPEGIAKLARERLDLVGDGEIVFYNSDN